MDNKLIAFYCVYNESEYLEYSLRSIYDYVDEIIIFEGTWGEAQKTSGNKRSDDGTLDIIRNFPDPANKIKLHLMNEPTQLAQRSRLFEFLPDKQCWVLLIDGDEIYPPESMQWIRRFVDDSVDGDDLGVTFYADVIRFRSLIFVNDFYHVSEVDYPRLFKVSGGKCSQTGKLYYNFLEPNVIGALTALGYVKIGHDYDADGEGLKTLFDCPEIKFFHYSYCHSSKRFQEKKKERTKIHGQFAWELRKDQETGEVLIQRDDANIVPFTGEHPEIMKSHPKYGKRIHKIIQPPKTFCVLSHSGIGNLILTTPCIKALRNTYPDAQIFLLTWPRSSRILEGWPIVDLVVEHHPVHFIHSLKRTPDAVILSPAGAIWESNWDQVAKQVLRASVGQFWAKHEAEYCMDFAYQLGYTGTMPETAVHIFDENHINAHKFIQDNKLEQFICINASYLKQEHWHMKHIGNNKFAEVINNIATNNKFVFIGNSDDKSNATAIIELCKNKNNLINACGLSPDIKDTAALIAKSKIVVGNDGGLSHIASAIGVPTVTAFTFTNPVKNRPLGNKSFVAMRPCDRRFTCQHGQWKECETHGCLNVPLETILNAVNQAMSL